MNFELTDDQRSIQRTARDFLAARYRPDEIRRLAFEDEQGFTAEQWSAIVELGWPALVVAEEDGGLGLGVLELAVVQEELGYALAPTPFLSNLAASLILSEGADAQQRAMLLAPLAAGERRGTVALLDDSGPPQLADDGAISATKIAVPDAAGADVIVVAAGDGRHLVVDGHADGVGITAVRGLDPTRKLFTVRLDDVPAIELEGDTARAYDVIAVAVAAESVGVAQRSMEMAVTYARDRKQFGRAIGTYQAVSHACAQMLLETEGARSAVLYAAWALEHERESGELAAAMAKSYASDAGWRVPAAALQVHGGIGFTWEHDLHLWLKRGRANAHSWGDARSARERIAMLLEL